MQRTQNYLKMSCMSVIKDRKISKKYRKISENQFFHIFIHIYDAGFNY